MTDYQKILYIVDRGAARITLNRPDKRNALDAEIIAEVKDAINNAATDDNVRVVVISGAGKDFCSGADLAALRRISEATVMENVADARNFAELFVSMRPSSAHHRSGSRARACGRLWAGHRLRHYSGNTVGSVRLPRSQHRVHTCDGYGGPSPFSFRETSVRVDHEG